MKPLDQIRIVDLTHALAGPFCTYQLGLLGAEVIKVEPSDGGDDFRAFLPDCFDAVNGGKKSVTLNLKTEDGRALLQKLLADADIVIENYRAGVAKGLGLDWEDLHARHPRLIYCSITGFGQEGERAKWPAIEWSVQAAVGLSAMYLPDEADPHDLGIGMLDIFSGTSAFAAILTALLERGRTGEGTRLDVTMADAALTLATPHIISQATGKRQGLAPRRAGVGRFRARDRRLFLSAPHQRWFAKLSKVLGAPELVEDERFATVAARSTNLEALRGAIEDRLAARDAAEWQAALLAEGVPSAVVGNLSEMIADGYFERAGTLATVHSAASTRDVPAVASIFSGRAASGPIGPVPALGADTGSVLGLSDTELAELRRAGAV